MVRWLGICGLLSVSEWSPVLLPSGQVEVVQRSDRSICSVWVRVMGDDGGKGSHTEDSAEEDGTKNSWD